MVLAIIACIPVSMVIVGYFVSRAYREGLKHGYELRNNITPTEDKNALEKVLDTRKEKIETEIANEKIDEATEIFNEWRYGV